MERWRWLPNQLGQRHIRVNVPNYQMKLWQDGQEAFASDAVVGTKAHVTKAGSRVIINTSPEPVTNWTASIAEDIAVFVGIWAAIQNPWLFLGLLVVFLILVAWLLPKIWRGIKALARRVRGFFGGPKDTPVAAENAGLKD